MSKAKSCHCCSGTGKEMNHDEIGAAMRKLREAKDLTQGEVGDKMGKSKPYISDLERGKRNWNPDLIHAFKKAVAA